MMRYLLCALFATVSLVYAGPAETFTVTDEVLVASPPRFGANVRAGSPAPWSTHLLINAWNSAIAMEPVVFRWAGDAADGGGDDFIEAKMRSGPTWHGGVGFWKVFASGFWDGATIDIYRLNDGRLRHVRRSTVKRFVSEPDDGGEEKIYLSEAGPEIRKGDLYVMTRTGMDARLARDKHSRNGMFQPWNGAVWTTDPDTHCPEDGSTASMKVTTSGKERSGMSQWYLTDKKDHPEWLKFAPGKSYRCQIWLRQEGLDSGKITVQIGSHVTKVFDVTGEWQEYVFDVPNTFPKSGPPRLAVTAEEEGTFWIDNFLVWQTDVDPFGVLPQYVDALREFRPGTIRSWGGLSRLTLDAWIQEGFQQQRPYHKSNGPVGKAALSLNQVLNLCREVGAEPWLILYPMYTREENERLMEYLGAPADVGYGKLRAAHGQVQPWTEVFETIHLECGNETWNKMFAPMAWPNKPELYAAIADRQFGQLADSPYFQESRFHFIANGFTHWLGWPKGVGTHSQQAETLSYTVYFGGWDGEAIMGENDSDFLQNQLLYLPLILQPKLEKAVAMHRNDLPRDIDMAIYEGGPGYPMPRPGKPSVEQAEKVGKSMVMGVLSADAYLWAESQGIAPQGYYEFKTGVNWSSHSDPVHMRPHPSWLTLQMRNLYCQGDRLAVRADRETRDIPDKQAAKLTWDGKKKTITIPGRKDVPMTLCHAYRDGDRYAVYLLNRRLDKPARVKLDLPYAPSPAAKRYTLAHDDPRATNRHEQCIAIREASIRDFADGYVVDLPPASAVVIVSHATPSDRKTGQAPCPQP
jgi:hypothetical protein